MIEVCDLWSLDEFAEMDEGMMEEVLKGWEKGEVRSFRQVGGKWWKPTVAGLAKMRMECWLGMVGGLVGGLAVGAVVAKRFGLLGARSG